MPPDPAPDAVRDLKPLGEYDWPSMPTEEAVARVWARLKAVFRREDPDPFIADDQLERTTLDRLDRVAAPPACGPVLDDLAADVARWRADALAESLRVVVVPPCDESNVLAVYAGRHGHATLPPPARAALLAPHPAPVPNLAGDGLLVVPQLERWFLRHRNGLGAVRALLVALYQADRPVLIGCASWAWAFLSKAVDVDQLLPAPVTFQPFDTDRLREWFSDLAQAEATSDLAFRFPDSGSDVFVGGGADADGADNGADAAASDYYFRRLAAHSLGVPWVAWHQWRRSLFHGREGDDNTLFVGDVDRVILPGKHPQTALLVLHALLIHGPLTPDEIRAAVPLVGEPNVVPSLVAAGFAERDDDGAIRCRPAAYPSVRAGLADAGFPMDLL